MVDVKCRQIIWVQSLALLFHFYMNSGCYLTALCLSLFIKYHLPDKVAMRINRSYIVLSMMPGTCTW